MDWRVLIAIGKGLIFVMHFMKMESMLRLIYKIVLHVLIMTKS